MQQKSTLMKLKVAVISWADARVNGEVDTNGLVIPFRNGDFWVPSIDVRTGRVKDWPVGVKADIRYAAEPRKSEYLLTDYAGCALRRYRHLYPPESLILGRPDVDRYHIVLSISGTGKILNWPTSINMHDWLCCKA